MSDTAAHEITLPAAGQPVKTQILVIGSGAGGATTAATLAAAGFEVTLLEEGPHVDTSRLSSNSTDAITRLYRNGGMTPILGNQTIAYVEGRCVGGSTEINSAFWHRLPADCYHRWRTDALLADFSPEVMEGYFDQLEAALSVSYMRPDEIPRSSTLFRKGIEQLQWHYMEVPRCQREDSSGNPFAPGAKQSMQRTYIPIAVQAGTTLISSCKATEILHDNQGHARGVHAQITAGGKTTQLEIQADTVFVCCGAVQTPALLRRSGIKKNVGDNLCIHPMIKAAALFPEAVEAHEAALPVYQVKEFWPTITIGGSVFTPGFLAMILADNWEMNRAAMQQWGRMALYYAATRGMNRGTIRALPHVADGVVVRYRLSEADQKNLSIGLAHLGEVLFAAGATAVYPSLRGYPVLKSADQCRGFAKNYLPVSMMGLSTVHAFSSCPMGENPDFCATDSFGKVTGFRNLYVNDASLIPDSPGVNPQGTTMAIALRNLDHFIQKRNRPRKERVHLVSKLAKGKPAVLITGAPGWLGTRLAEVIADPLSVASAAHAGTVGPVRCLVRPGVDTSVLTALREPVEIADGDLLDAQSLRAFCRDAEGATLFHIAGVVHPTRATREFQDVNVAGTRRLLEAAEAAGVKRVVAVSSNSPFGFNPNPEHLFDEASPYSPYMGYGRSKAQMERLVHAAQARGRLQTVIIRPPWFYGPHQPPRQTLFFTMIKQGRFPILGDGSQRRSMAYVDNICQGLLLAAAVERANGQTYWIADERPYTMNEIVETVRSVLEQEFHIPCSKKTLHLPSALGSIAEVGDYCLQSIGLYNQKLHVLSEMNRSIACSVEKAKIELGYTPNYALRRGMAASIEWCLANGEII